MLSRSRAAKLVMLRLYREFSEPSSAIVRSDRSTTARRLRIFEERSARQNDLSIVADFDAPVRNQLRSWSAEQKLALVAEACAPGAVVLNVARRTECRRRSCTAGSGNLARRCVTLRRWLSRSRLLATAIRPKPRSRSNLRKMIGSGCYHQRHRPLRWPS